MPPEVPKFVTSSSYSYLTKILSSKYNYIKVQNFNMWILDYVLNWDTEDKKCPTND